MEQGLKYKNNSANVALLCVVDMYTPLLMALEGLFCTIAAQKRTPQGLIISNPKQKLSSLFITQHHEREQCPDLTTLARLHNL